MKLLAITSCPNGIAHTYMAAENLQKAADKLGVSMKVETQGSIGVENEFTEADIAQADGIIIAADKYVDKSRFLGKKLLVVGVQEGIRNPEALIQKVISGKVPFHQGQPSSEAAGTNGKQKAAKQNEFYRHLMSGVSYMIPFIVVGGLLIAIALSLGGVPTPGGLKIPEDSFWKTIESLGAAAFTFMVPILAGFIAYSIADRPGIAPGMIGGFVAANGSFYGSEAGAGFIGGIIAGFLAGYVALGIKKLKVPKAITPIMPIIIIPVMASLIVGLAFIYLLGGPIAQIFESLTNWLAGMQGTSSILLALILGAMISFDMGGPVNKVAFLFGSAMIGEGNYEIMGPIAVAICIPPIGLGLATFLFKDKFHEAERESGKASFTMGLFGITEGAIPFASQDPLRVIPSVMIGSMTGSVIAMLGQVGDRVAHGGPIVAVLGAVDHVLMFFVAVIVGSIVTALMIKLLKKDVDVDQPQALVEDAFVPASTVDSKPLPQKEEQHEPVNKLTDIVSFDLIDTALTATSRDGVIDEMIEKLNSHGVLNSASEFKQAILNREQESSTGIGMNIAVPHGKSNAVIKPRVVFGIKQEGVDWNSIDGSTAKLIFMIAIPAENKGNEHLKILQMLSRKLMDDDYRDRLLQVQTKQEAYDLLDEIH
ncbi:PTS system D-mannose-specific IIA component, Fru family /PTS system D-mannose-specific IIB component, Fru family /PTS system D-mannose-specific IIC component, Fru family [Paenibacillus uliginis N3/975]|uniref:PTS system D-mannose-specific IIA component, Fru family /PTS system D-mannose-specific IIB component, Fru family /PTS system D-mannose-specific IIC component, Fru family n=1 Tax=Paenibacillus uliginis N3/975 TaxID=1313296 RepID=A0A1X7HD32_9BACL|nr:PTS fructose transporter subunit IIABC [Paenibacillus uliginis]SMF84209.1 PTS system D-mannose-specific IIA component, Fru family /PTS system D-mannose-specific IIB component, Fru family /PTS system D-mannose-specific IIC component, Fru family [Paenibacillus uliginis N3/975]